MKKHRTNEITMPYLPNSANKSHKFPTKRCKDCEQEIPLMSPTDYCGKCEDERDGCKDWDNGK